MTGPCAKQRVFCTIIASDGTSYTGENYCENPQPVCPRAEGEDYTKCRVICKQVGHAEEVALSLAGESARGSEVVLTGHDYYCPSCQMKLFDAGVQHISVLR